MTELTPVMQQYLEIKKEYNDAILFFRMGDFYEMFFDDAKLCARLLNITLTSRDKNKKDPIPMAGIPYHAVNGYLSRLLRAGYKVAICEQTSLPGKTKGPVKREIVQVVTPGTAMGEEVLDSRTNNYLVSLALNNGEAGIAMADLSTGEFIAGVIIGEQTWLDELERITPNEIILSENEPADVENAIKSRLNSVMITYREGWTFERNFAEDSIREHFKVSGLKGFGIEDTPLAISAAGGILSYMIDTQKASLNHITSLKRYRPDETMFLDSRTRRNLELTSSFSEDTGAKGTLFGVIDETVTPMGGRLLKSWLTSPLLETDEIIRRHDGVQVLVDHSSELSEIRGILSSIRDVERLISRVCLERANPRDMLSLAESLEKSWDFHETVGRLNTEIMASCTENAGDLRPLGAEISEALVDEPPVLISDGGIFRDGYHQELDELRTISRSGRKFIADLQEKERQRTGISNLKIKYNNVFGYFIEISKANLDRAPEDYYRKQTLVNAERFITPELKEYESKVLSAGERINDIERELFIELRGKIAASVREIQAFSQSVAVVDVLHSFARVAVANNYVRPKIDRGNIIEIKNGRHPVVETILPAGKFVSNDTLIDNESDQILIITGPNMAGKSTYLRQVGLIVLLAQSGSFVPASSAHIGVVDRIFTRVGASDNLAGGESTFLVEMNETANILNNCTPRSLILFDEVGRGTSTFDGLSIAWAIVEYLHQVKKSAARTLFATHYHELTELEVVLDRVKNYNIAVKEWNDEIVFLRKIIEGGSDQSLGIQVARLAGLPPKVISRAKEILTNLEANEFTVNNEPKIAASLSTKKTGTYQMSLFELPEHPVVEEIRKLDIDNLTPIKALLLLGQLKQKALL
ncbi:MAG: DNA mismatch repair protein MutS [Candidatus Latescibacteria bacterium]|nr:DNA mismatch repair protein MutS [Candidatus Latescibacterota bacterium]